MKLLEGPNGWGLGGSILLLFVSSHLIVTVFAAQYFTYCVQFGQAGGPHHVTRTIGTQKFEIKKYADRMVTLGGHDAKEVPRRDTEEYFYGYKRDTNDPYWKQGCPAGWEPDWNNQHLNGFYVDLCPPDVEIRTYLVRQNGKVLRGWLHFEVEIDKPDQMEYIYLQTSDEVFNAIGEFVVDEAEQCKPTKSSLQSPTKHQFFPCSATGLREAKTSGAIFMAKRNLYKQSYNALKQYLPSKDLSRGIHFTWRLNEYWCNRHQKIRLDAYVWSTNTKARWDTSSCGTKLKDCRLKRKHTQYWIWPKWFGAADIKTEGSLDCNIPAINYKTGKLSPEADAWISKSTLMARADDYMNVHSLYYVPPGQTSNPHLKSCQVNPHLDGNAPTFGGRCKDHYYKNVSKEYLQGCNLNAAAPEFQEINLSEFTVYSEYVNEINTKRLKQCDQTCEEPNTANNDEHLKEILAFPKELPDGPPKFRRKISFKTISQSRRGVRDATFWQTRKYHGNLCIFLAMFLIPVSNFIIRYYKETFMHHLSLGCAPWFWFHLFVCIAVPVMYRSSYSAMQQNILNFGTSETSDAYLHRVGGYVFIWVFLLMVLLGAVRPVVYRLRIMAMALHSVTGFGLYFLAIFLVINSTHIPASPTLHKCDEDGLPIGFSFTAKAAVAWFIIDLLFHILLTAFQWAVDRKHLIERPGCGLPFVPMLPAEAWRDLHGAWIRKIVLVVYVSVSVVMTFTTIGVNFRNDDRQNCILGNMSCNLEHVEPNGASSPFGCLPISLNYYNKVFQQYRINFSEISE